MPGDTLARAVQCVQKSMERYRLRLPLERPTLRIEFGVEPSWQTLALLQAFDLDVSLVFNQSLRITDAYYGCFEADFEPTDLTHPALRLIADKVRRASDFDNLVVKYKILKITMFNFPVLEDSEVEVRFDQR